MVGTPALAGIRVLELGNLIAAPFAGRIFADFGAEVIKVERPSTGDEARRWRALGHGDGASMLFHTLGRNKRSVTIDLSTDEGQELARSLVAVSDVVIENFRPGTLEKWGLGPSDLSLVNPGVVVVRVSGYGQTGPYRDRAGFGGVAEAFGGLRHVTGFPDRPPVRASASIGDCVAGLYGVIGALMLLLRRQRGMQSTDCDVVDVALYEAVHSLLDGLLPELDAYGAVRERSGGSLPGVVPNGIYRCQDDRWVVIGGNTDAVFARLMAVVERDDLAADPELIDGRGRAARARELDDVLSAWTAGHTAQDVLRALIDAGVPASGVYDAADIAADPHYRARGMVRELVVQDGDGERVIRFPGVVPTLPSAPGDVSTSGPELGQDTDDVFAQLGISPERLDALRARGIV